MEPNTRPPATGLRTILNILLEPSTAFSDLKEQPSWLLPLVLIIAGYGLAMFWYFNILDIAWFMEDLLYQGGAEPTEEQAEQFQESMENVSPTVFIVTGTLGAIFSFLVIFTLQAGYLSLVSALTGDGYRFRNWFCLATWTSIPSLFSVIGLYMTLLLNPNGQIGQTELDPLSLGNLGLSFGDSMAASIANGISLTYFWTLMLLVMGYRQWLQGGWLRSAIIALLPQIVLVGGVIALFASGAVDMSIGFIDAEGGDSGGISISLSL